MAQAFGVARSKRELARVVGAVAVVNEPHPTAARSAAGSARRAHQASRSWASAVIASQIRFWVMVWKGSP